MAPAALGSQASPPPTPFAAAVRALWDRSRAPALSAVVVGDRGRVLAAATLGLADVERRVAATDASLFRVGSVSKLLTATAMLRLVQAARVDLDAPIGRYLPDVPADKQVVTPRQLAGHLGGFAQYGRDDYISTAHYEDVRGALPRLLAQPLIAPPGVRYAYSSYGFNVLGAVLQAAGGAPFDQIVAREVLTPLALTHTTLDGPIAARTILYSRQGDTLTVAPPSDLSDRWPSGGYLSTAEDLAKFGASALAPPYLSVQVSRLVFVPQRDASGNETSVGIAWRIGHDAAGRLYVHHGGDALGGRAVVLAYPDQRMAIGIVANMSFAAFDEREALALLQPFLP